MSTFYISKWRNCTNKLLKIVFASIVIISFNNTIVSAQKTNTAAWVKSTNCFKGFSSRVTISKIDKKKKYTSYPNGYEYYAEVRNDYDRKVSFAMYLLVAGKKEFMGDYPIVLNPGDIKKTYLIESPTYPDSVKIEISYVCFGLEGCVDYYQSHIPVSWSCYAECDVDNRPNTPINCGYALTNNMKNSILHYLDNFASYSIELLEYLWSVGNDTAALFLGYVYLKKWEREKEIYNPVKARAYFDTAVNFGNTNGYYAIGQMYEHGLGVNKDIPMAISYYEKGMAKSNACCTNALYLLYSTNDAYKDPDKAKDYKERLVYLGTDKKPLICRPEDYYDIYYKVIN